MEEEDYIWVGESTTLGPRLGAFARCLGDIHVDVSGSVKLGRRLI